MNWNKGIRQFHRWMSLAFTAFVIANLVVMGQGQIALVIGLLTLVPLLLLLATGLYLFALPCVGKWRNGQQATG